MKKFHPSLPDCLTSLNYDSSKELTLAQFFVCLNERRNFLFDIEKTLIDKPSEIIEIRNEFISKICSFGVVKWPVDQTDFDDLSARFQYSNIKPYNPSKIYGNKDFDNGYFAITFSNLDINREHLIKEFTNYIDNNVKFYKPVFSGKGKIKVEKILIKLHKNYALPYLDLLIIEKLYSIKFNLKQMAELILSGNRLPLESNYNSFKQSKKKYVDNQLGLLAPNLKYFNDLIMDSKIKFLDPKVMNAPILG